MSMKENRLEVDKLIYEIKQNGLNKERYEKAKSILLNKELNMQNEDEIKKILEVKSDGNIIEGLKKYRISKDRFKIKVKNLGRIKQGEYEIDGITPLTGPSDLGKSTILKAMYFAIKICSEFKEEESSWLKSLRNKTYEEMLQNSDIETMNFMEKFDEKDKAAIVETLVIKELTKKFVNSVYSVVFDYVNKDTCIELYMNEELIFFMNKELDEVEVISENIDVIYVSDSKILNYLSYMTNDSGRKIGIKTNIACPDYIRDLKERLAGAYIGWWNIGEGGTELSEYLNIKKVPVVYEENSFKVKSSSGDYCRPSEVGDGLKLKSILHTLAYNGHLNKNTVLLLDEPESSLYPVEYENLINLLRALNCPIGMATHSPNLVEKCSEYSSKCYLAEKDGEDTIIKETDSLETITRLLSKIIIEEIVDGEL
ncbi:MAG: AAA family ATPase [Clostridium sp.]